MPAAKVIRRPPVSYNDLCTVYPIGDPHFGMYAWAAEAGEDFDLKIAERIQLGAINNLLGRVPASKYAVIVELGDFFHSDNSSNRTEASGHALDVDTRWRRVFSVGVDAMARTIEGALRKHEFVTTRIVQGNHDPHSSSALAVALAAHFRSNRRCKIDLSPAPRWYYRHGRTLIGATHGHQCKPANLPGIMAAERAKDWGETAFRYFYYGHVHHSDRKGRPGCTTESFETLAPRDAWHAGEGYHAGRSMTAIILHKRLGEIDRKTCPVQMITR